MVVHLVTNASVLDGPGAFQKKVYTIHSLGPLLPLVEWTFIFIPILFHAIVGVLIVAGAMPNTLSYPYGANCRYTLQRVTGMIAFVFIVWHVFHMHGWFHAEGWMKNVVEPFGGGQFRPYNAASTAGRGAAEPGGGRCCTRSACCPACFTWPTASGRWASPGACGPARRPSGGRLWACGVFGVLLGVVGLSALGGMRAVGSGEALDEARQVEDRMYEHRIEAGEVTPDEHKRATTKVTTRSASQRIVHHNDTTRHDDRSSCNCNYRIV